MVPKKAPSISASFGEEMREREVEEEEEMGRAPGQRGWGGETDDRILMSECGKFLHIEGNRF